MSTPIRALDTHTLPCVYEKIHLMFCRALPLAAVGLPLLLSRAFITDMKEQQLVLAERSPCVASLIDMNK